jgi:hypothetical protein
MAQSSSSGSAPAPDDRRSRVSWTPCRVHTLAELEQRRHQRMSQNVTVTSESSSALAGGRSMRGESAGPSCWVLPVLHRRTDHVDVAAGPTYTCEQMLEIRPETCHFLPLSNRPGAISSWRGSIGKSFVAKQIGTETRCSLEGKVPGGIGHHETCHSETSRCTLSRADTRGAPGRGCRPSEPSLCRGAKQVPRKWRRRHGGRRFAVFQDTRSLPRAPSTPWPRPANPL